MATYTAYAHLAWLGLDQGKTILIHGAGSTIGYAAVQIALIRGLRVIATAGATYAQQLRDLGAAVTSYGDVWVPKTGPPGQMPCRSRLGSVSCWGAWRAGLGLSGGGMIFGLWA